MLLLYPIGLVFTYLLLRYLFKYDRIYRGVFAEKREQQWGEIIVFLIYYALLVYIFCRVNPQVGVLGRTPKNSPSDLDKWGVALLFGLISCNLGAFLGSMRSFNRCVTCHAISKKTLLKVIEELVTRLDKQPYVKHKWGQSVYRIKGGVLYVHELLTLEVELSWILKLNHPNLRDELVARIQVAAEAEQGYVESKPGIVILVNRAAIALLLGLWLIWIVWFI